MEGLSFQNALELYQNKNYQEAFTMLKALVEEDNLEAAPLLGLCYLNGNGISPNFDEAFRLFSEASLKQNENAYFLLGYCYEMGYGTIQNDLQAILWYKNSAKLGKPKSMLALGRLELKYDKAEALKWLKLASDNKMVEAMLLLADYYSEDLTKRLEYLELASLNGSAKAKYLLGEIYLNKEDHEAKIKAENYFLEAVNLDYPKAYLILGAELIKGDRLIKNPKKGFMYLEEAYEKNIVGCEILLADAYYYGLGTKKNPLKAKEILEIAARDNNSEAMLKLANFYADKNQNSYHDLYISLYWWEQAGILGNVEAMLKAAWCYENKIGTNSINLEKAYYWLNMASLKGSQEATNRLKRYKKNILGKYRLIEK